MKNLIVFFAVVFVVIEVTSGVKPSKCTCSGSTCSGNCHIYESGDNGHYSLVGHCGPHAHGHGHSHNRGHGHTHGHGHHSPCEDPYSLLGAAGEGGQGLSDNGIYSQAGGSHHGKCAFCGKHGCHGQCHVYEEAGEGENGIYSLLGGGGGGGCHHHHGGPSEEPLYDTIPSTVPHHGNHHHQSNHIPPVIPPRPPGGHPPCPCSKLKRQGGIKKR